MDYLPPLKLIGGLVYLLMAGDLLVRAALALSRKAGVPPMLVGLTVVAFGTSAPELFVAVNAAIQGFPDIARGTVVGSNIANVLLVMGVPALVFPLVCNQPTARRDASLMVAISVIFAVVCARGPLGRLEGAIFILLLAGYLALSVREADFSDELGDDEIERVLGLPSRKRMIGVFLALGLLGLPLGANLTIDGAVEIARDLGISPAAVGLTAIAIGTSLPELATTLMASLKHHSDLALGNVLGSNVFNILAIMGVTALVAPAPLATPQSFLIFHLPVMLGTAVGLSIFAWAHRSIGPRWGTLFLVLYAGYVAVLLRLREASA